MPRPYKGGLEPDRFDVRLLLALWEPDVEHETIGEALGVSRGVVRAWRYGRNYMIPWWRADRLAIRIGTHPSAIWPDWWQKAMAAA